MNNQMSNLKSILLSLLLLIGVGFSLHAQDTDEGDGKEARKEISESYQVSKDFTLGIDNKYGSIDIVNWDKNEVEVTVEVMVNASSKEKSKKILEKIKINSSESASGVDFVTEIEMKNFSGKTSIVVNYTVNAPVSINVKLVQKYGSIFLEEISGDADIIVKYGSLKAHSLMNAANRTNELLLAYSSGAIKNAGILNAKVAYSEIKLGNVDGYEGKVAYSEFMLKNLGGNLATDVAYSEFEIGNVEAGFEAIEVLSAYSDIEVIMDANASYSYDLETKYGSLDVPGDGKVVKDDHGNHQTAEGKVGGAPTGKIVISAKYADVEIR